jgi:hypothetical protein
MNAQTAKRIMRHAKAEHRNAIDDNRLDDAELASAIWHDAAKAYVRAVRSHQTQAGAQAEHNAA